MQSQPNSSNTPNNLAPRFPQSENVARTVSMSSLELVDFINGQRLPDDPVLDHADFMKKVPRVLKKDAGNFSDIYLDSMNRKQKCYRFPKRESCLMAMSYSYELQAAVYDHMTDLEEKGRGRVIAALPDFSNPAAAARAWAEQFELHQAASQALAIAAPKVEFVDRYVEATGLKGFRQTAKLLGANEARFREFLLDKKIMYRMGGEWQAHAQHINAGRFEVKTDTAENGHAFNQIKFTPKGVNWVAGLWAQYKQAEA
ncbi:phage antirepressor KilAC domain-containing protein [Pseudomonas sp. LPH60]|uniref:phage antirepressor KilAC domain-containing protein n=1 Tax=Pseudomonas sp. LPH60 TaxID=3065906 RepID=UPI00273B79CD|nr:phage antirepressor KilAC domain-containing protein [Pseudomonas sp. LPH60]MDP4572284.1 phage antirepressor KilAC domain-containing protein [Pseudomonas sp. LPH60]